jgi:hypothetical protein
MTSIAPLLFGEDLGMGANKLYGSQGGLTLPSLVAAETGRVVGPLLDFRHTKPPLHIRFDGAAFYVGSGSHDWGRPIENLDYDRMIGVPETRAVLYGNLSQYIAQHGDFDKPLAFLVGLPLEPLSGPDAQAIANAVRQWLKGEHRWEADGKPHQVSITDVRVTSQPSGALFDYILDEKGQFIPERKASLKQEIGIVSIGFNTLELLTVKDKAPVQAMTAGRTMGVRRLLELVNPEGLYTLGELDGHLRSGQLDTRSALPVWGSEVSGQIEKIWGQRWRRFTQIIVVGGGALLLRDHLIERFNGKVYLPDDPVIAIARGLYKLALQQSNRKGQAE